MAAHDWGVLSISLAIKQHCNEQRLCILLLGDIKPCTPNALNSKERILLHCFAFYTFKTGKLTFLKTTSYLILL